MKHALHPALRGRHRLLSLRIRLIRARAWWARRHYRLGKRALDVAVAALALLICLPLFLAVAAAIKLNDGGPVLFWQRRIGRHGRVFAFPKFRSMRVGADAQHAQLAHLNQHGRDGVTFKSRHDPRVTLIGRLIRRTSIDELPQLWSVLRGDMSLVGPRPALESEVARYSLQDRRRLEAEPGLTCIWQVSGRSEISFGQQVEMDVEYIASRSLARDLGLIVKTVPAVVTGRGAY